MGTNLCQLEENNMTHKSAVVVSRVAHITSLALMATLTWAFIFTVM